MDKQTFKEHAKKNIDNVAAKLETLESKKDNVKESMKATYNQKLTALKEQKNQMQSQMQTLENTASEKWDEAKTKFSQSADAFKQGASKLEEIVH